jgi:hypothetical protein
VYSVHDAAHCDVASWTSTARSACRLDRCRRTVLVGTVTVGAMADGVVGDLTPIMTALRDAGGSDIDGHHVCVVPATGVGVALSTSNGFIAFEPAAIIQINELVPDAERSMYSVVVVFAHEFAHQLQYWYGNPFEGDKSMRRTELAADCMGSARRDDPAQRVDHGTGPKVSSARSKPTPISSSGASCITAPASIARSSPTPASSW